MTMQPGDFTDLRPDDNGRDVHGHVITKDGTVSPYSSLVATTYGTAAIRQKTANRIVLGPQLYEALRNLRVDWERVHGPLPAGHEVVVALGTWENGG